MKFVNVQDVEAPVEFVFASATNYAEFEANGLRAGAEVTRVDANAPVGPGSRWQVVAEYRGRQREIDVELTEYTPPGKVSYHSRSGGFEFFLDVELAAIEEDLTKMKVFLEVVPQSLSARVLLQSVRLGKSALNRKFDRRLFSMAEHIARDFAQANRKRTAQV